MTMNPRTLALESLAAELRSGGFDVEVRETDLRVNELELVLVCQAVAEQAQDQHLAALWIEALHADWSPQGIADTQHCSAPELELAVRTAARRWIQDVLPVLQTLITGELAAPTRRGEFGMANSPARPWHLLAGPMQSNVPPPADAAPTEDFLSILAPLLPEVLEPEKLHWVKCVAGKLPNGEASAECRVDNFPWRSGSQKLSEWAQQWPPAAGMVHAQWQFLLLQPQDDAA